MFIGEYHHNIDEKGRIIIPSKLRSELTEDFVITIGLDNCLFIYPKDKWIKIINKYEELPNVKDTRNFMRTFLSGATYGEFDKQGRINISSPLIKYASLKKECVIIGAGNRLEIWAKDDWDDFFNSAKDNMSDIAENLFDGSLDL